MSEKERVEVEKKWEKESKGTNRTSLSKIKYSTSTLQLLFFSFEFFLHTYICNRSRLQPSLQLMGAEIATVKS